MAIWAVELTVAVLWCSGVLMSLHSGHNVKGNDARSLDVLGSAGRGTAFLSNRGTSTIKARREGKASHRTSLTLVALLQQLYCY